MKTVLAVIGVWCLIGLVLAQRVTRPPQEADASSTKGDRVATERMGPSHAVKMAELQARERRLIEIPPANATAAELDQELADVRWAIARGLAPQDISGAISYARASLQLQEAHPDRWDQLGDLYTLSGELTSTRDALIAYDNALFLDPTRKETRLKLASACLKSRQIEQALRHLELYLCQADDPQQEQMALGVYVTACAVGQQAGRGIAFCRVRAGLPGRTHYQIGWAILEQSLGNSDEALRLLEEVEKKDKTTGPVSAYAARLRRNYAQNRKGPKS